jgi:hypothetical protein
MVVSITIAANAYKKERRGMGNRMSGGSPGSQRKVTSRGGHSVGDASKLGLSRPVGERKERISYCERDEGMETHCG